MVLVTRQAPDFTSSAVLGNGEIVNNFNFKKHVNGKAAVLFFYPLDFTFVCPSELIAFDHRYEEFKKRGVEVVGVSIDSEFTHNAWRNTPTENGGIGAVKYALAADVKHEIAKAYGIEPVSYTHLIHIFNLQWMFGINSPSLFIAQAL